LHCCCTVLNQFTVVEQVVVKEVVVKEVVVKEVVVKEVVVKEVVVKEVVVKQVVVKQVVVTELLLLKDFTDLPSTLELEGTVEKLLSESLARYTIHIIIDTVNLHKCLYNYHTRYYVPFNRSTLSALVWAVLKLGGPN